MLTLKRLKESRMLLNAIRAGVVTSDDRKAIAYCGRELRKAKGLEEAGQFLCDFAALGNTHAQIRITHFISQIDRVM